MFCEIGDLLQSKVYEKTRYARFGLVIAQNKHVDTFQGTVVSHSCEYKVLWFNPVMVTSWVTSGFVDRHYLTQKPESKNAV